MSNVAHLMGLIGRFPGKRLLVVGDVMLDRFVLGSVERISPEAPVPILRAGNADASLGGAANVARNLAALGAAADLVGVVGDDAEAGEIDRLLGACATIDNLLIRDDGRPTTLKTRFVSGAQHLLRVDREDASPVSAAIEAALLARAAECLDRADAVVLSDYAKGVLSPMVTRRLIHLACEAGRPVFVDPKGHDFEKYRGATAVTPNRFELNAAVGRRLVGADEVRDAAAVLRRDLDLDALLVTRGEDGMILVEREGGGLELEAQARRVVDVSGAGDTVAAVFAAAWACGADGGSAATLANLAAGLAVGKRGTAAVERSEVEARVLQVSEDAPGSPSGKLRSLASAVQTAEGWRAAGLRIGFTNGCFDLLHPGHVRLLAEARALCDRLIVGLNADASVTRLKGPTRPIQNEAARALVLGSLAAVDAVVLFEEDTPIDLITALRPDVLVKGADYRIEEVVGAAEVLAAGGSVRLVDLVSAQSTTSLVSKAGLEGRLRSA